MSDDKENVGEVDSTEPTQKLPSVFKNYLSLIGAVISAASIAGMILLLLLEYTSSTETPYLDILIYMLMPRDYDLRVWRNFTGRSLGKVASPEDVAGRNSCVSDSRFKWSAKTQDLLYVSRSLISVFDG